jgi:hypothetical protein
MYLLLYLLLFLIFMLAAVRVARAGRRLWRAIPRHNSDLSLE